MKKQVKVDDHTDYGYLFWLPDMKDKAGKDVFEYEANGYGGQHIRIIPEWNIVIVVTSDADSREGSSSGELIDQIIIPAVQP